MRLQPTGQLRICQLPQERERCTDGENSVAPASQGHRTGDERPGRPLESPCPPHTHLPSHVLLPLPGMAPVLSLTPPSWAPAHNLTLSTGEKWPNVHFTLLMLAFCFSFRSNHLLLTSCWVPGDFSVAGNLIPFLD